MAEEKYKPISAKTGVKAQPGTTTMTERGVYAAAAFDFDRG